MEKYFAFESKVFYDFENNVPYLLAWQPYEWDDGYFWTQKEIFLSLVKTEYNMKPHNFTFSTKREAVKFAKRIKLKNYKIIEMEI